MKVEEIRKEHFVSVVPKVVLQTCKGLASWLFDRKEGWVAKAGQTLKVHEMLSTFSPLQWALD